MAVRERDRDRELLIPMGDAVMQEFERKDGAPPTVVSSPPVSLPLHHTTTGVEVSDDVLFILLFIDLALPCYSNAHNALSKLIRSWSSKKFMTGCVILLPIAITFYITWWFISFVDGFFSPIYAHLGINVFGLGFVTSITFIFLVGVFMSSWLGASLLGLGEWFIKKMPLVCHIYSASKQISAAISPDQTSRAFKEVVILRHPRIGEYAIGFITSSVILRRSSGDEELSCVYIPTNNLYLGDIYFFNAMDVIRPNLSVREGIEIVLSGGMSVPRVLSTVEVKDFLEEQVMVLRNAKFACVKN